MKYTGGRTKDTIVSWVAKKSGPPSEKLACEDIEATVQKNKLNLIYFGDQTNALFKTFQ